MGVLEGERREESRKEGMDLAPSFWRQLWTLHSFFDIVRIGLPSLGTVTMIIIAFIIESVIRRKKGIIMIIIT